MPDAQNVRRKSPACWATAPAADPVSGLCTGSACQPATTRSFAPLSERPKQRSRRPRSSDIDDWSWRKTWRYGTIIVDLERRSVIDILEDRSVESAANWLKKNPSVEVVSRDRCGLYAQAVREGAPQAVQTADRFHLVQNLRLALFDERHSTEAGLSQVAVANPVCLLTTAEAAGSRSLLCIRRH